MGQDTTSLQNALLNDFFSQIDFAGNLGITTKVYLSLHFFDPGENGTQLTNEIGAAPYTQYGRQEIVRSGVTAWDIDFVIDSKAQNQSTIAFPQRTTAGGTDPVATYWGLGTSQTGAGQLLKRGPLIASGAKWLYGISNDGAVANEIRVVSKHSGTAQSFADGDEYAIQPLYKDVLPAPLVTTTRYFIKIGSLPGGVTPYAPAANINTIMNLATTGDALVVMTEDGAFNLIKAAPITITNGSFPVFNVHALSIFQS